MIHDMEGPAVRNNSTTQIPDGTKAVASFCGSWSAAKRDGGRSLRGERFSSYALSGGRATDVYLLRPELPKCGRRNPLATGLEATEDGVIPANGRNRPDLIPNKRGPGRKTGLCVRIRVVSEGRNGRKGRKKPSSSNARLAGSVV